MAPTARTIFLSHDHRDRQIAHALAATISRVTLKQLNVWFSSDTSAAGGMRPGAIVIDEVRQQLKNCKSIIPLLTRHSVFRPWILFEVGFAAGQEQCEVIPTAVGISNIEDIPLPLAMYQCFQLSDYQSLKEFVEKLLHLHNIIFDEEMSAPLLKDTVGTLAKLIGDPQKPSSAETETAALLSRFVTDIKDHFDLRFLKATETSTQRVSPKYTIRCDVQFPDYRRQVFLEVTENTMIGDVLDNIYLALEKRVKPYSYLIEWIVRMSTDQRYVDVGDIQDTIPARFVFSPGSSWEVIKLDEPYISRRYW